MFLRGLVFIIVVLAVSIAGQVLYLKHDSSEGFFNDKMQIMVYPLGKKDTRVEVKDAHRFKKIGSPRRCMKNSGRCLSFEGRADFRFKEADFTLKALKDGKIEIHLLGSPYNNKNRRKVRFDYQDFSVNGINLFEGIQQASRDRPIAYSFDVRAGDIATFKIKYRRHLPSQNEVDWMIFLSVVCVSVFAAWRLNTPIVDLIRNLYINGTRGQKIFLTVFFGLLFFPMSDISQSVKSEHENRNMAEKPQLIASTDDIVQNGLNLSYGKRFDQWFNDHFTARYYVISSYHFLQDLLRARLKTEKAFEGANHNYFLKSDLKILDRNYLQMLRSRRDSYAKQLRSLKIWAEHNHIKLYVLVLPVKGDVLQDSLGKGIYPQHSFEDLLEYLRKKTGLDIVYPKPEILEAAKTGVVFFKQDHHWTEYGAFVGYTQIMQRIKRDFPDVPELQEKDFNIFYDKRLRHGNIDWQKTTYMCSSLIINNDEQCRQYSVAYKYFDYLHLGDVKRRVKVHDNGDIVSFNNPHGKYNLYIQGTSHSNQLSSIMPYSFKKTVKNFNNLLTIDKKDILSSSPDVLLLLFQSTALDQIKSLQKD